LKSHLQSPCLTPNMAKKWATVNLWMLNGFKSSTQS
jgi:hypothetical protein